METIYRMTVRTRILVCAALLAVMTLAVGAVRLNEGMQSRQREHQETIRQCRAVVGGWTDCVPRENRAAWSDLVGRSPEFCLRVTHTALKPLE